MVYNNFILSFQLDPSIFNPFIDTNKVCIECVNDEGEHYTVVIDDDQPPSNFRTSSGNGENTAPDSNHTENDYSEFVDVTKRCYQCRFCIQSGELSEGSDSYICSRDGETLSSKRDSRAQCFCFCKNDDDPNEEDFQ